MRNKINNVRNKIGTKLEKGINIKKETTYYLASLGAFVLAKYPEIFEDWIKEIGNKNDIEKL